METITTVQTFFQQNPFVIGIILALGGWLLSYRLAKRRSVTFWSDSSEALSVDQSVKSSLTIHYDENEVSSLWVTTLSIQNRGNTELKKEDFILPLTIQTDAVKIVAARVNHFDAHLKLLEVSGTTLEKGSDDQVSINIVLFNPGDILRITLMTETCPTTNLNGRISGVSILKPRAWRYEHFGEFGGIFVIGVTSIPFMLLENPILKMIIAIICFAVALVGFVKYLERCNKVRWYKS